MGLVVSVGSHGDSVGSIRVLSGTSPDALSWAVSKECSGFGQLLTDHQI